MIGAIYLLGIVVAILVNIRALTLIVLRYIPFPATARVTGILIVCLALFSLEHFIGLGKLYPAFVPLTAVSLYVIWHERLLDEVFKDKRDRLSMRSPLWSRLAIGFSGDR